MVELSPMATTAWAGLAGAVLTGIYAGWGGIDLMPGVTANGVVSMTYMTIGGGVLAMTWWNSGVKVVGPSKASIFFNIVPIAGMIFGVVFLGESLGGSEIMAGLWIVSGVYLSTQGYKKFQQKKRLVEVESL
jgi:drug/metabolite transporter (DMT)-like permease